MNRKILSHFRKVDPIMHKAAKELGPFEEIAPKEPREYFAALCSTIIGQQLSDKAALPIEKRFVSLFRSGKITAGRILKISDQDIRNVGMSWSKVGFIKDLALRVEEK